MMEDSMLMGTVASDDTIQFSSFWGTLLIRTDSEGGIVWQDFFDEFVEGGFSCNKRVQTNLPYGR